MTSQEQSDAPETALGDRPHMVADAGGPPKIFGLHIDEQPTSSLIQRLHKVWDASGLRELGHKLLIIGPEFRAEEVGDGQLERLGLVRAVGDSSVVVENAGDDLRLRRFDKWCPSPAAGAQLDIGAGTHVLRPRKK